MEVPITDKMYTIFVKNGTAVSANVFNVNNHPQVDFLKKIEQFEGPDILVRDMSLSQKLLCAHQSAGTISVITAERYL